MSSRQKMEAYKPAALRQSSGLAFVRALLDQASFVEQDSFLSSTGSPAFERRPIPGDGLVSGFGTVAGSPVYIAAQDGEVYKGSVGMVHAKKFVKICEQAITSYTPLIIVLDSGGVRVEEGLAALDATGQMMQALQAAQGIVPVIVIVKGLVVGALSLVMGLADAVIVCEERGGVFLHGPGVTLAEEESTERPEDLGGAAVLARIAGTAGFTVKDEAELVQLLARLLSYRTKEDRWIDDPNRLSLELNEAAAGLDEGIDMRQVLEAVFDHGTLWPAFAEYASELFCGLARLGGTAVAVVAETEASLGLAVGSKLENFLKLAESFNLPLISFTNSEGFRRGSAAARDGIAISAADLCQAFLNYDNVRLNVYVGKAFGSHLLAFNSKFLGCDRAFAWPTAELGLITADQALSLFGAKDLEAAADPVTERAALLEQYAERYNSLNDAATAGIIDEIITPEATRPYLYKALQSLNAAL